MLKDIPHVLQQVNKNTYALTLMPSNYAPSLFNSLFLFGGHVGAVEADVDLLAYYNMVFGNITNRNWLQPLELRFADGQITGQDGLLNYGSKYYSRWLTQKTARVIKTVMQGYMFKEISNGLGIVQSAYASYPFDIWQSNGVEYTQENFAGQLKKVLDKDIDMEAIRPYYENNEIYCFDNKTVLAIPTLNSRLIAPPPPPDPVITVTTAWQKTAGINTGTEHGNRGVACCNNAASPMYGYTASCGAYGSQVIISNNGVLVATIACPNFPNDVCYNEAEDCFYVVCVNAGVRIINNALVLQPIIAGTAGIAPYCCVYNPLNFKVYVTCTGGTFDVLEIQAGAVIGNLPMGTAVFGICFGNEALTVEGTIFVTDFLGTTLWAIDPVTFLVTFTNNALTGVTDNGHNLFFNENTQILYNVNTIAGTVETYNPDTTIVSADLYPTAIPGAIPKSIFYDSVADIVILGTTNVVFIMEPSNDVMIAPVINLDSGSSYDIDYDASNDRYVRGVEYGAAGAPLTDTTEWFQLIETIIKTIVNQFNFASWLQVTLFFQFESYNRDTVRDIRDINEAIENGLINFEQNPKDYLLAQSQMRARVSGQQAINDYNISKLKTKSQ